MMKSIRSQAVMALVLSLAAVSGFAQDAGKATYTAKCLMCHGPAGIPNPAMAKTLGVPSVSDAAVKAMTVAQIGTQVKAGKGKMKAITGLSDAQVAAVAAYFKSLEK